MVSLGFHAFKVSSCRGGFMYNSIVILLIIKSNLFLESLNPEPLDSTAKCGSIDLVVFGTF